MKHKLLVAVLSMVSVAFAATISEARIPLHGNAKYKVANDSNFPVRNPPRSFVLHCLNINRSSVNPNWASIRYRYPWALRHQRTCPSRFLGNGITVLYLVRGRWQITVAGPEDVGQCPTHRPRRRGPPSMPRRVGRDMFGTRICPNVVIYGAGRRPARFYPSLRTVARGFRWSLWSDSRAVGRGNTRSCAPGGRPCATANQTITFTRPRWMCNRFTYTRYRYSRWHGVGSLLQITPSACAWYFS
jgi:hypothetical protein